MLTFIIPIFTARVCTKPFFSSKVKILISRVQGVYKGLLEGVKLIILLKNIFIEGHPQHIVMKFQVEVG